MSRNRLDVLLDKPNLNIEELNEIIQILESKGLENLNYDEKTHLFMAKELLKAFKEEKGSSKNTDLNATESKEKRAIEILKNKKPRLSLIKSIVVDYHTYCSIVYSDEMIEESEFNLLKEVFCR